jgi:hypothetical protein
VAGSSFVVWSHATVWLLANLLCETERERERDRERERERERDHSRTGIEKLVV